MGLEKDFLSMTQDTITIAEASTFSKYGAPTFASASTAVPTYIEMGTRMVVDAQGNEQNASGLLYVLSTTASISPQAQITMPSRYGMTPEIIRVDVLNDQEGQHHLVVAFR